MISIVTATYNRAHTLPKLYQSLLENYQDVKELEWVVIDDGSYDQTKDLIKTYQKVSPFPINYFYQENKGKMAALNYVMKEVKGDHLIEIDSDDYLLPNAIKQIEEDWKRKKEYPMAYGLLYLRRMTEANESFFKVELEPKKMFDLYMKDGFKGETTIVFDSAIRKQFHHRLEHDEKFVTEARLYHEMDLKYDGLLCINKEIVGGDYLEDGYTHDVWRLFKRYPHGYFAYFKEALEYPSSKMLFEKRLYLVKHYILFGVLTGKNFFMMRNEIKGFTRILFTVLYLPGKLKTQKKLEQHRQL